MFRAIRPRGEDDPTVLRDSAATPASVESLLALSLCATVILASVAFLRRSSDLSRALAGLQEDSARTSPEKPRRRDVVPGSEGAPDLVIIVALDGLRADRLALHGYERDTAPRLCSLGAEGVTFHTVAAQASQPLVSHKSILTGKYPATLMLEETGADLLELSRPRDGRAYLVDAFSAVRGALAAGFGAAGFRTAGFTSGSWTGRTAGFAHGFEVFDDAGGGLGALVPRALAWLEHSAVRPALLFLQADDLACPYAAREPFERAFCRGHASHGALAGRCDPSTPRGRALSDADRVALSDHYDGCLLGLDAELGAFIDGLRARGLYDRALFVVTAGHGESLGERGSIGHGGLHMEELLVPLILKFPARWKLGPTVVAEPVEMVDLLPTLFALCRIPAARDLDGTSLLPSLRGVRGRDTLVAQTSFEQGAERVSSPAERTLLRPGRWQVIHDVARSQARFFALQDDPRGLAGLPVGRAEFEPLLQILLERGRAETRGGLRPDPAPAFGEALARALEALGYGGAPLAGSGAARVIR